MKVGAAHLTYCTNIHPGEAWAEVRDNLREHVVAVKRRVCPDRPFGVGLRLSHRAAHELDVGELRALLAEHDLYVFTINGFPYGTFHGAPVKQAVYRPDWLEPERVAYTQRLADILVEVLPAGMRGSISTVPGCFAERARDHGAVAQIAANVRRAGEYLEALADRTGKHISLALEPEPACMLETVRQTVRFFEEHIDERDHVGICLDACHAAVAFEDLHTALDQLRAAVIPIAKLQLSCGLRVQPVDADARRDLAAFADDTYLHQVNARYVAYVDLPEALADPAPAGEWRIHYHVPIFHAALGRFSSTQAFLAELLAEHVRAPLSEHLEVETYTWNLLPAELRAEPIADAIARELTWVKERIS